MKKFILFLELFILIQVTNAQILVDTTVVLSEVDVQVPRFPVSSNRYSRQLDVKSSLSSVTNTTAEAFRQLPSVMTDMEGGVVYRGAVTTGFLLNGIPYGLTEENSGDVLIQLPALFFNQLSLTSFPSIHYGPEGEAGVLNLKSSYYTKDDPRLVFTIGGASEDRYSTGVLINQHAGKLRVIGKYNFRHEYRKRNFQKTTTNTSGTTEMKNAASARPYIHVADLFVGYDLTASDQISGYGLYYLMDYNRYGGINNTRYNQAGEVINKVLRHRFNSQRQDTYAVEARWSHHFPNPADKLDVVFNYNNFVYDETNDYQNENPQGTIVAQDNLFIRQQKDNYYFSGAYQKSLADRLFVNVGYQGRIKKENYKAEANDWKNEEWIVNTLKSDIFDFKRTTHLLSFSLEKQWEYLSLELGGQGEYSWQKTGEKENESFHLYPRMNVSLYTFHTAGMLNLSYQQRIIRPYGADLNTFIDRSDATYFRQGNPDLKNELIHLFELSYPVTLSRFFFSPAVYYRYRNNRIMNMLYEKDDLAIWKKENTGHSQVIGGELSLNWSLNTLLFAGLSGNIYRDEIDGRQIGYDDKKSQVCYDMKGVVQVNIKPTTELQLDGFFVSDQLTPQGKIKSRSSVNVGLSQYLLDRKLCINLSMNNLFDGLKEITVIHTEALQMRQIRNRDVRVCWLTVSYML